MAEILRSVGNKAWFFCGFAVLVVIDSAFEIVQEIAGGEPYSSMVADTIIFVLSSITLLLLLADYLIQRKSLRSVQAQLDAARGRLLQIDESAPGIANKYRDIIQKQFEDWDLTGSEQQIAIMLIKGLSFREVAEIRKTKDKSVRQQATRIYKKANVTGRHELAGWFFEDLFVDVPPSKKSDV